MTTNSGAADAVPAPCPSITTPGHSAGRFHLRETIMTNASDNMPSSGNPSSDWTARRDTCERLEAELQPGNKAAVFDALATAGVTHVHVDFDGYGDSGQIEHIEFTAGDTVVGAPQAQIEIARASWSQNETERSLASIADAIEQLIYDILNATYGGWEDNEGAFGQFTFDVGARTITLDYNERYIESANHQQTF
jgi:hypothetical protein